MHEKAFRIDWYAHNAFVDFSELEVEEIGVVVQVINLIYIKNGPVDYDPKFIGKNCNISRGKCEKILASLIEKRRLFVTEEGKLSQKMCEKQLKTVQERRKKASESGKDGAETRWHIKEKQRVSDDDPTDEEIASFSNNSSIKTPLTPQGGEAEVLKSSERKGSPGYDVLAYLTNEGRQAARQAAPQWDIQHLAGIYNPKIHSGEFQRPRSADLAFAAWCARYTKGKPP
jgi:uncharacterized protein YdaU (DUF1376 family)